MVKTLKTICKYVIEFQLTLSLFSLFPAIPLSCSLVAGIMSLAFGRLTMCRVSSKVSPFAQLPLEAYNIVYKSVWRTNKHNAMQWPNCVSKHRFAVFFFTLSQTVQYSEKNEFGNFILYSRCVYGKASHMRDLLYCVKCMM